MSILSLVPATGDELPSQQIARRIRGIMAEHNITGVRLAEAMRMDQATFSRRYRGDKPWSTDELGILAVLLNRDYAELVAAECANRDLNPEPADLKETGSDLRLILGTANISTESE